MSNKTTFSSSKRSNGSKNNRKLNYLLIPLAIVIIILPLIVHEYKFSPDISSESWFASDVIASDFFLFYKTILLIGVGFVALAILLYKQGTSKIKPFSPLQAWYIPLAIYAFLVIVSALASTHSSAAWNGSYEQFDTVFVLLSYCILTLYSFYVVNSHEDIQSILKFIYISIAILSVIGLLQLIGADPFATTFGKYLISVDKSKESIDAMTFTFAKNRVYMTLFNPNYVGVFASLLFPITMGMAILLNGKKHKIISGILSILLIISVFGSQSKTGLITLMGTSVLVIIAVRKKIFKNRKSIIIIASSLLVIIAAFFIVNAMQDNAYLNSIKNALTSKDQVHTLEAIETTDDYVLIKYNGKEMRVRCLLNSEGQIDFSVADENEVIYDVSYDDTTMKFTLVDPIFNSMTFMPAFIGDETTFGFEAMIDNKEWYFKSKNETEGYSYMNKYNKFEQIKSAPASLFTDHESIFTGRGYLWSRTMPLIKDYILIGSGPNTFAYEFPQNDYVGKYNNGFDSQIVTKPHNMYLQMAIETGMISCIAFIALCVMYIVYSFITFKKSALDTIAEQMGVLICISVIGYMVSGLINDSTIGVAPIFWVLLGVGFACNKIIRTEQARKKKIEAMNI